MFFVFAVEIKCGFVGVFLTCNTAIITFPCRAKSFSSSTNIINNNPVHPISEFPPLQGALLQTCMYCNITLKLSK